MTVLLYADERFADHDTGPHHPERPARLEAVHQGLEHHGLLDGLERGTPRRATDEELQLVHPASHVERIERLLNIAEYKRRQSAPGPKLTPRAFGLGRR